MTPVGPAGWQARAARPPADAARCPQQPLPPPPGQLLARLLPRTLFGRLAWLLVGFVLLSHVLALTVMFEVLPPPPHRHGPPAGGPPPSLPLGLLLDIGLRLAALTLAAWIAAGWLSAPIKRLALAAHQLGEGLRGGPAGAFAAEPALPEVGAQELRDAARGFNRMRARIRQQLDERDRFVAAVSHDLRTPLTRLRLRAEGLADEAQRLQFRRDIGEMDEMINATLDYLRGAADAEPLVRLDVQALAASVADDQQACGHAVRLHGRAAPLRAQASALRRCLCNLVDNAVRYGAADGGAADGGGSDGGGDGGGDVGGRRSGAAAAVVDIVLVDGAGALRIEVHDRGPGIPAAQLQRVLEPFYRVDGSRNRRHGGVGLGLSIARDIARQHGGELMLRNADGGGLVASIELPR